MTQSFLIFVIGLPTTLQAWATVLQRCDVQQSPSVQEHLYESILTTKQLSAHKVLSLFVWLTVSIPNTITIPNHSTKPNWTV